MNEENPNVKVIEFKKNEEEEVPKFVVETLEQMLQKAKEGKLNTLIAHFNHGSEDDEEQVKGGTILWNKTNNPVEMLGLTELVKSLALEYAYAMMHGDGVEEGE